MSYKRISEPSYWFADTPVYAYPMDDYNAISLDSVGSVPSDEWAEVSMLILQRHIGDDRVLDDVASAFAAEFGLDRVDDPTASGGGDE